MASFSQRSRFSQDSLADLLKLISLLNKESDEGSLEVKLPENVIRINNNISEEINIPPPEKTLLLGGNDLVHARSLGEYGRLGFSGVETLNRIQSEVFETAYKSDENLLICAPTGAGKTNIALLTIIKTLKQHRVEGVLKKNKFKIIYVTPMKALAGEMTTYFNKRLECYGVHVKEFTGDMQLTKEEILETQMLVTTPEKWDVFTRKSTGEIALSNLVKLMIIDEVHLLDGDRGSVIETLVARTHRQVENSKSPIRIVGLSATLPNYKDVASFLHVKPQGLYYFDARYRPVPLEQTFIGVKAERFSARTLQMDQICYDKLAETVKKGLQVMVFVNSRNETERVAKALITMATRQNQMGYFVPKKTSAYQEAVEAFSSSKRKVFNDLLKSGFGIHHAGLLRTDRNLIEKTFASGAIKVLVCTATLAWGVNLPAHAVIIRGTEIFEEKKQAYVDMGILDVIQIFGRAGRPQFDTSGHGIIITKHSRLSRYLSLYTNQVAMESQFVQCMVDNLNAEISLNTICNIEEAVEWLSYTYLFIRMKINPKHYSINPDDVAVDPSLKQKRQEIIKDAARKLHEANMIVYDSRNGNLRSTDLGRTASHFNIKHGTVQVINRTMTLNSSFTMTDSQIFRMVSQAQEFKNLKVRKDEELELKDIYNDHCEFKDHITIGIHNPQSRTRAISLPDKVNILMQANLSRVPVDSFSLLNDMTYLSQNVVRIMRALMEICLNNKNAFLTNRFLQMAIMMEQNQWDWQTPFRQFKFPSDIIKNLEKRKLSIQSVRMMDSGSLGYMLEVGTDKDNMIGTLKSSAYEFPLLQLSYSLDVEINYTTFLKIELTITPDFNWNNASHGKYEEPFWIWVEDPGLATICKSKLFRLSREQAINKEPLKFMLTIELEKPYPRKYVVKASSDRWLGCTTMVTIDLFPDK